VCEKEDTLNECEVILNQFLVHFGPRLGEMAHQKGALKGEFGGNVKRFNALRLVPIHNPVLATAS
jgi:hypothetical protein